MALLIEREDYEFMLLSANFCSRIDKYVSELGVDSNIVEAYKNDDKVLALVVDNSGQFHSAESFTQVKIKNMRIEFSYLVHLCKNSKNYTVAIGEDLGIEPLIYHFESN